MKHVLLTLLISACSSSLFSQIKFQIEVLPDNETYLVSFVSDTTYTFPGYIMASGQVTVRVPHGIGPNRFIVSDLNMETTGGNWSDNSRQDAPVEAPSWDYISFGLTSFGTNVYQFQEGVPIPAFSFKNGADACADSVEIIVNGQDPFYPPNSVGANIGNTIVLLGGGLNNIYDGTINTGKVPCTPFTQCTDETIENVYLCPGQTYQGQTFAQDTVLETHYTSFAGCDSAFITNIFALENEFPPVDTSICEGEFFHGVQILQNDTIQVDYTGFGGCDSTVTYLVEMVPEVSVSNNMTVVPGQAVFGIPVYSDTTIVRVLTGSGGCDSTVTTQVTVFNVPVTVLDVELCQGETWQGNFYVADTTLIDTLTSSTGFDSILLTNLSIYPAFHVINHVYLCQGESYNGVVYNSNDSFSEALQTIHGCDSTITTNVHVLIPQVTSVDTAICRGELYQGILFQQDTVFTAVIYSSNGCDSLIMHTQLNVLPSPEAQIAGDTERCAGETGTLTAYGGTAYLWSTGETGSVIDVDGPGTVSVTVTAGNGCQDITSVTIVESDLNVEVDIESPMCMGDLTGMIRFNEVSGGMEPYLYSITGGDPFTGRSTYENLSPGTYELEVKDALGCNWTFSTVITSPADLYLDLGSDHTISLGETVALQATTNLNNATVISWMPETGLDCAGCLKVNATPFETVTYQLILADSNGCTVEDYVTIFVDTKRNVFVPNAFSPNGDGINDFLTVFGGEDVTIVRQFTVFERWGGQVFQARDFEPNAVARGWDGSWRGEPAPAGMYAWMAEVEFLDGRVELFEGGVHLIK